MIPKPKKSPGPQPSAGFRERIEFYLVDTLTPTGKIIDVVIIFLNILVCLIYVIGTYSIPESVYQALWRVEEVVVAIFVVEYIARVYGSPNRIRQVFNVFSIIDLIAILPTLSVIVLPLFGLSLDIGFISLLRAFRVFRIFRFLRFAADADFFFGQTTNHLLKIMRLVLTIFIIFFVSSGLFYQVEHLVNPFVKNFGHAFYFTVVTLSTVGFGDITPFSEAGRWVTLIMIISGIILIPWQASQVVREWIRMSDKADVVCPNCGLMYHDKDASHCKSCGHVIYQEYEGD